jgi:hypothetical protein
MLTFPENDADALGDWFNMSVLCAMWTEGW